MPTSTPPTASATTDRYDIRYYVTRSGRRVYEVLEDNFLVGVINETFDRSGWLLDSNFCSQRGAKSELFMDENGSMRRQWIGFSTPEEAIALAKNGYEATVQTMAIAA